MSADFEPFEEIDGDEEYKNRCLFSDIFKEQGKGYVEIPFMDAVHIPELTDYFNNNDGHFFYDNI